ncbi:hypothetical protein GQ473_05980, partial [archaeon]|nr:hypothetical protein [archaeon]
EDITVTGYVSKPALTRGTKDHQSIFVNGRYIKNKIITDSVYNAYKTLLPKHRHPFFVLFIKLDPKTIDVNIHPSKKEIKVRNDIEENLSNAVYSAVDNALKENTLIPEATISNTDMQYNNTSQIIPKAKNSYNIPQGTQSTLRPSHAIISETITKTNNNNSYIIKEQTESYNEIQKPIEAIIKEKETTNRLPEMRIIGQINKTYIIAETQHSMLIIDQHAAHERIFYEKFMNLYDTANIKTQNLINTQILEFPAKESLILSSKIEQFKKYGFDIETFGNNTFIIRTVPVILGKIKSKDMIKEIIDDFITQSKSEKITNINGIKIISMACRAAIKGGDELTTHTIKTLIDDLTKTKNPFTCPHGRPTIINMNISEFEKKFKRVV